MITDILYPVKCLYTVEKIHRYSSTRSSDWPSLCSLGMDWLELNFFKPRAKPCKKKARVELLFKKNKPENPFKTVTLQIFDDILSIYCWYIIDILLIYCAYIVHILHIQLNTIWLEISINWHAKSQGPKKIVLALQERGSTHVLHTPPVIRVVLLHKWRFVQSFSSSTV